MEEIFEKRGIGKPKGTWEEKQKSYFEMVKSGKIKNPVAKLLNTTISLRMIKASG